MIVLWNYSSNIKAHSSSTYYFINKRPITFHHSILVNNYFYISISLYTKVSLREWFRLPRWRYYLKSLQHYHYHSHFRSCYLLFNLIGIKSNICYVSTRYLSFEQFGITHSPLIDTGQDWYNRRRYSLLIFSVLATCC